MRWIEPQSRFIVNTVMKRDLDTFTESARTTINRLVLGLDIVVVLAILWNL